ncbi:hypothetical protein ZEAMMB73_Zm00001d010765 [Zea mays]|uniref:Uncharacterized protein n=1 Tax=Zea mays TaxID=4577 RepID=A0A1D6FTI5_MAIZE|nr:hypothetical protein ZEAMMB73_Zm00001d010765 [Zea mays]
MPARRPPRPRSRCPRRDAPSPARVHLWCAHQYVACNVVFQSIHAASVSVCSC